MLQTEVLLTTDVVNGTLLVMVVRDCEFDVIVVTWVAVLSEVERIVEVMVLYLVLTLVTVDKLVEVVVWGINSVEVDVFVLVPVEYEVEYSSVQVVEPQLSLLPSAAGAARTTVLGRC